VEFRLLRQTQRKVVEGCALEVCVWKGKGKTRPRPLCSCCWTGGSRHHPVSPWLCDEAAAAGLLIQGLARELDWACID
jgi:hypothetical protein